MTSNNSEKSPLEILKDFACNTGRRIETFEDRLSSTSLFTLQQTKRTAIMQNSLQDDLCFCWYNHPKSFSDFSMYSGVFLTSKIPEHIKFIIRKKNFFDRLIPASHHKRFKTGDFEFDSKFMITGQNLQNIPAVLKNLKVQNLISEIIETDLRIQISFNSFFPDFEHFKNKKNLIGIFIKDFWILEIEVIERIIQLSYLLSNELN